MLNILKSSNLTNRLNVITEYAIPEEHDKVITSLRTAYTSELTFDKEQTSYDDLLDGLRLSLKGYNMT
jgi:hypothetical protein